MQPTTLIEAMSILSRFTGKSLVIDRAWLLGQVNEIRRAVWKQEANRLLYFKKQDCECVECYHDDCVRCCGNYMGITMPQNVTTLQYLSVNGLRVDMQNVSLANGGCCSVCGCLKAEMMVKKFALKRELPKGYKGLVVFKGMAPEDKGKRIGVKYVTKRGAIKREDLLLSLSGVVTTESPAQMLEVTFLERCGWVDVQTEEAWSLGSYHPAIRSPQHLRIKLTGVRAGDLVEWEGLVEPHDVYFDTDQVEWSNPLDWKNHFQFLDLHFKTGKSGAERYAYETSAALATAGANSELAATQGVPAATCRPTGNQSLRNKIRRLQSSPYPVWNGRSRRPW